MNSKIYKYCSVPMCQNTTITTPQKLFVHVPNAEKIRKKWYELAGRDIAPKSKTTYFCEDHFDMPNDMENFLEYSLMGLDSVKKMRMRPNTLPSKFSCQPDRKRPPSNSGSPTALKRQRKCLVEECMKSSVNIGATLREQQEEECMKSLVNIDGATLREQQEKECGATLREQEEECMKEQNQGPQHEKINTKSRHKSVQVFMRVQYRSKSTQTELVKLSTKQNSPIKIPSTSVSTSPFKVSQIRPFLKARDNVSVYDSDVSIYIPPISHSGSSHSFQVSSIISSSSNETTYKLKEEENFKLITKILISKIEKKPLFYIGIPESSYFLIKIIKEHTGIPELHIMLILKKIRLNNTFLELADDFAMSTSYASKIFSENINKIANVMQPFIVKLDKVAIKKRLPMSFRHSYYNVSCIIDCLEIEIEKPSKAVNQSLTWSEYKKTNTIKYLISCTPNGLVNYISPGFGGRINDSSLVENCDFLNCLPSGSIVMADRGFKHIEQLLYNKNCQLVRPPSVETGSKLTKLQVKKTKQIASLRIHIERVIRRVREFSMLKPHSCINSNLIGKLDNIMVIVCGLINLQNSLIRK